MCRFKVSLLTLFLLSAVYMGQGHAATKYSSGITSWSNGSGGWATTSGGPYATTWGGYDDGVFEGTASTVTVVGSVNFNSMTFNVSGYTVGGGTFGMGSPAGGTTINVASGITATVKPTAVTHAGGTVHWNKAGEGTLNFAGTDATSSDIYVHAGTLTLQTGANVSLGGGFVTGQTGGNGTLNQTGGTVVANGNTWISNYGGTSVVSFSGGSFTNHGSFTVGTRGSATLNVSNSANVSFKGNFWMGHTAATTATSSAVNLSGGSLTVGDAGAGQFLLGQADNAGSSSIFTQTGGSFTFNGNNLYIGNLGAGTQTLSVSGGTFTSNTSNLLLAIRSTATLNISGTGSVSLPGLSFGHGDVAHSNGTVNLDGGSLSIGANGIFRARTDLTGTFNFNGGTLKASANNTTFMQGLSRANVRNGGAKIDTNGFNITIAQTLEHSNIGGDAAIDGGLTKNGLGTLTLTALNTFNGGIQVNAGTLEIAAPTTIESNSAQGAATNNINVAGGATLLYSATRAAGFHTGTITLQENATLTANAGDQNLGTVNMTGATMNGTGVIRVRNDYTVNASALQSTISVNQLSLVFNQDPNITFHVADGAADVDLLVTSLMTGTAAGTFNKNGAGTMTTTANNTYTGVTNVNAGELIVNGNTVGQGTYNVASGARLGGNGSIGASVVVASTPGELSPGDAGYTPSGPSWYSNSYSAGTDLNTVGSLGVVGDVDLGGALLLDVMSAAHDELHVTGDFEILTNTNAVLEINGTTDLTTVDFWSILGWTDIGSSIDLVTFSTFGGGAFDNVAFDQQFSDASGRSVMLTLDGDSISLVSMPEPASLALWSLLGLALAAIGMSRRRTASGRSSPSVH